MRELTFYAASESAHTPAASGGVALRFIGRQPILDARRATFGYELLFHSSLGASAALDANAGTAQVIDSVLMLGLETISPAAKVFVPCGRGGLTDGLITLLQAASTVIEVAAAGDVDDAFVSSCAALKEMGYKVALSDYHPHGEGDRLLEFTDYLKLDYQSCDGAALSAIKDRIAGSGIALIAENIDTEAQFRSAVADGFSYFQGYFFARPEKLERRELTANKMLCLELMSAVSFSPLDSARVERLMMAEASLCFRLLRLVNSAAMGIRNPVRTVRQAMLMIGEDEVRKLIMVASAISLASDSAIGSELIVLALHRARFCELLASAAGQEAGEQYLIGLLSVMDAMLLIPLEQVIQMVPLRAEATAVLRGDEGRISLPLRISLAFERRQWNHSKRLCDSLNFEEERAAHFHASALRWATKQLGTAGI